MGDEYGLKERLGWKGGQIVNDSHEYTAYGLLDTGTGTNRKVWLLPVPPGYRTNPSIADIDYAWKGDKATPWYHLKPSFGGKFTCRYWDKGGNSVGMKAPGARPVYREKGSLSWLNNKLGQLALGEYIDPQTGLPEKMIGTPQSPYSRMSVESAKKLGWIYPNPTTSGGGGDGKRTENIFTSKKKD